MPHLPIPPFFCGTEPDSFAEDTIARRLPEIAQRVISENNFDQSTNERLRALISELPHGLIRQLIDEQAPDWLDWQKELQPFLGKTWLEAPFFASEMYFYRRILEATGYFQPGPGYGVDPYGLQKKLGLEQAGQAITQALPQGMPANKEFLRQMIDLSLWGNQVDLSLWPVQNESSSRAQGRKLEAHLLVNEGPAALTQIEEMNGGRVELILDNFGTEFIFDLLLADALLTHDSRVSIRLNVKPHPCYVSDVIPADVPRALHWLKTDTPAWARQAGERLERARQTGQMQVATHFYWASPSPAWKAPPDLWADLSRSAFMISKGDVNYRRWLGDARWSYLTSLEEIIDPPTPLLLLRVSKSDVAAGLAPGQAEELFRRDPAWQLNGHWGMIQFVKPKKKIDT